MMFYGLIWLICLFLDNKVAVCIVLKWIVLQSIWRFRTFFQQIIEIFSENFNCENTQVFSLNSSNNNLADVLRYSMDLKGVHSFNKVKYSIKKSGNKFISKSYDKTGSFFQLTSTHPLSSRVKYIQLKFSITIQWNLRVDIFSWNFPSQLKENSRLI